ncbi:MAG TPA: hypothetical protein VM307_15620, partial [Egibacteraceae bacterium]|nr:hypothetical protein [Egibacteraceae bacterium]
MRALIMAALVVLIATPTVAATPTAASPEEPGWGPEPPAEISRPAFGDRSSPIRPGASMNGYCTYNFVFYERVPAPQVPRVYIGTAAHCTERLGERTRLGAAGTVIGTVVYDADLVGSGVDFSLIRIDADLVSKTNPTVLGAGGPEGVTAVSELT